MINIPKQYIKPIITSTSPPNSVRFHSITNENKAVKAMERRLSPTRRKAKQSKRQIEQRVSSDRRHSAFNAKA
ncbi:MAG: hypothetical protein HRT92_03080 [Piscirickettsiaceae bacterium]|nr:hypothetical protein [Piscirickettsiaceae bacterium]